MLKNRILVAIPLIVVAYLLLFYSNVKVMSFVTALLVLYGAWEWTQFLPLKAFAARLVYPILVALIIYYIAYHFLLIPVLLVVSLIMWVMVSVWVVTYKKAANRWKHGIWARAFLGLIFLPAVWMSFNLLYEVYGPTMVLYVLLMIWGADIGAYFSGRAFGKKKLMPHVSPNKTWEGALGGLLVVMIIDFVFCLIYLRADTAYWNPMLLFGFLVFLFALFGDLAESMFKREVGLKDSGTLLPGHGGLLDRLDSTIAVFPLFTVCMLLTEHLY